MRILLLALTLINMCMYPCFAQVEIEEKDLLVDKNPKDEEPVDQIENGNPRPVAISIFCKWGCNVGHKVCKFQKRESIELQGKCDATLEMCRRKCEVED